MKTTIFLPAMAALLILNFASCKKSQPGRPGGDAAPISSTISLNVAVNPGEIYRLNLSPYGNGAATIIKQASAYNISRVSTDAGGTKVYQYSSSLTPKNGNNTDAVVIKVNSTRNYFGGCSNNHAGYENDHDNNNSRENIIRIKFTIN